MFKIRLLMAVIFAVALIGLLVVIASPRNHSISNQNIVETKKSTFNEMLGNWSIYNKKTVQKCTKVTGFIPQKCHEYQDTYVWTLKFNDSDGSEIFCDFESDYSSDKGFYDDMKRCNENVAARLVSKSTNGRGTELIINYDIQKDKDLYPKNLTFDTLVRKKMIKKISANIKSDDFGDYLDEYLYWRSRTAENANISVGISGCYADGQCNNYIIQSSTDFSITAYSKNVKSNASSKKSDGDRPNMIILDSYLDLEKLR